jgi:hypothetical protein
LPIQKPDLNILYQSVPRPERFFRIAFQNSYVALQRRILAGLSQPPKSDKDFSVATRILNKVPSHQEIPIWV